MFITPRRGGLDRIRLFIKDKVFSLSLCCLCGKPHLCGSSREIKQMWHRYVIHQALTCVNNSEETHQISAETFVQRSVSTLGVLYGVLQGPNGARCLPGGPVSEPTGRLQAFHLIQTGMFSEPIKAPTSVPAFVTNPQAPRLPDKTFHRLLLAFVLYSLGWKVPHHRPPLRPVALFVYCCDKSGKLIRR